PCRHAGRARAADANPPHPDLAARQSPDPRLMLPLIAILFTLLLFIGVPVAFALAASAIPVFTLTNSMPPTVVLQKMVAATQNFSLLAVPFFILAGNLMNETGITTRLISFSRLLAG